MKRYIDALPLGIKSRYSLGPNTYMAYVDIDMTVKTITSNDYSEIEIPLIPNVDVKQLSKLLADIEAEEEWIVDGGKELGIGIFRFRKL